MKTYTIYTKENCNYCDMAKEELRRVKMQYQEVLVTPGSPSMDEVLKRSNKTVVNLTFPQVFDSEGNYIGGYMDLLDYMEEEGLVYPTGLVHRWGEQ